MVVGEGDDSALFDLELVQISAKLFQLLAGVDAVDGAEEGGSNLGDSKGKWEKAAMAAKIATVFANHSSLPACIFLLEARGNVEVSKFEGEIRLKSAEAFEEVISTFQLPDYHLDAGLMVGL